MITYSCDACGRSAEAPTLGDGLDRLRPIGWLFREGRVPAKNKKFGAFHSVQVLVCSDKCAKAYDRVECEAVGFVWGKSIISDGSGTLKRVLPLPVPKG